MLLKNKNSLTQYYITIPNSVKRFMLALLSLLHMRERSNHLNNRQKQEENKSREKFNKKIGSNKEKNRSPEGNIA